MPGFNGTGNEGKGPLTGKGNGYCIVKLDSKNNNELYKRKEMNIMPGGDRTGPRGIGSMTGRRMGICGGYNSPGYQNSTIRRNFLGLGSGYGRLKGNYFFGRGFRNWCRNHFMYYRSTDYDYYPNENKLSKNDRLNLLKEDYELLKKQQEEIQNNINALEQEKE